MKKYIPITIVLILILIALDYLSYSPPLLDRGSRNPLEAIHDGIAFIWHYTGAAWHEGSHEETARSRRMAMAVWYRPALSERVFGLPADDLLNLAERFESRGLADQAAALFAAGYDREQYGTDRVVKMLLACAGLGAWDEVIRISRGAVADNPDFRDGYYWWGRALLEIKRPEEAIEILQSAPDGADLHYRRGRARQEIGEATGAEREYLRAVELSPGHRAAWTALSGLYAAEGKGRQAEAAGGRAAGLTPEVSSYVQFGTDIIFRGHQRLPGRIEGDEEFPFALFYECLPGATQTVTPRLRLKSGYFQKLISLDPIPLHPSSAGEIRSAVSTVRVPWHVCPLPAAVTISFLDGTGVPLRILGSGDCEFVLGSVDILPRVFPGAEARPGPDITGGGRIYSLDKKTILAGTAEVHMEVERENRSRGLGLISFTEGSISLPGATEIARVECWTGGGDRYDFPIRLGEETADRRLEARAPGIARHSPARIFSSHREERKGKVFNLHSYWTVLSFPEPVELRLIKLTYTCPRGGGWVIESLFLVEDDENGDGT